MNDKLDYVDYREVLNNKKRICNLMEEKPELPLCWYGKENSKDGWWILIAIYGGGMKWIPRELTLDCIHEVENRLTDNQREHYISHVASINGLKGKFYEDAWVFLHATIEQRITTLAIVISCKENN